MSDNHSHHTTIWREPTPTMTVVNLPYDVQVLLLPPIIDTSNCAIS